MGWISGTIQFVSSATHKTFILSKAYTVADNLNNKYINCFYSVGPFEQ